MQMLQNLAKQRVQNEVVWPILNPLIDGVMRWNFNSWSQWWKPLMFTCTSRHSDSFVFFRFRLRSFGLVLTSTVALSSKSLISVVATSILIGAGAPGFRVDLRTSIVSCPAITVRRFAAIGWLPNGPIHFRLVWCQCSLLCREVWVSLPHATACANESSDG